MPVELPPQGAFDDGLPDIKVTPLDHTVSLGVIGGDAYMSNIVLVGKDIESLNKGWAIVSDNLGQGTAKTENIFKNKGSEGGGILGTQHPPLGISGQCTVSLNNIPITGRPRHDHRVYVDLAKQATDNRHGRRNMSSTSLANLALVAGLDEPLDIFDQHWPPEAE